MSGDTQPLKDRGTAELREEYRSRMQSLRQGFEARTVDGLAFVRGRSAAVDALIRGLWARAETADARLRQGVSLLATGGYGRSELFPYSDVDLLFCLEAGVDEREVKPAIRGISEQMWDAGVRFAPMARPISECEHVDPHNVEFALALLDLRPLAGNDQLAERLAGKLLSRMLQKERKLLLKGVHELTEARHAKYGHTIFHLEPNIKDCPGGLRDVHVARWLRQLEGADSGRAATAGVNDFDGAVEFLCELRCFLHVRHERDDNVLDWQSQDKAAEQRIGVAPEERGQREGLDAAFWMRTYFRNARSVERAVTWAMAQTASDRPRAGMLARLGRRGAASRWPVGYETVRGRVGFAPGERAGGAGSDPETVLRLFAEVARTGITPDGAVEADLLAGLPVLASRLEDGAGLWHRLREILLGRYAATALRSMHAVGLLDLLVPEFHGIDALVIRDAYHRYTVDEHTFVVIETLHSLQEAAGQLAGWSKRFAEVRAELPHPEILLLAALMHDTGKGRSSADHTVESARLTAGVLARLELEPYESEMVVNLVRQHLEMSSTLRRDIFDAETIRAFAGKVQTQEALRMLVLFTYADLNAVHPDALTPWKAENLWRLYIATANYLDHSLDEERVGTLGTELVKRVTASHPQKAERIAAFLEGFPERYVRTRGAEQVRRHFEMTERFAEDPVQIDFRYTPLVSELVLVTVDRASLFANVAGALAAWGMNIVTADAFSNRQGTVVDSFRFTDSFRTLELNESERDRFVRSVHDAVSGRVEVERLLSGRRRGRRRALKPKALPVLSMKDEVSSHSTLLEVVTEDTPGLLRVLSLTLAAHGCNIEVALVDTEGETAIDVFYITRDGRKLVDEERTALLVALSDAVVRNAR